MIRSQTSFICMVLFLLSLTLPARVLSQNSRKPELIRDTGVAEEKDAAEASKPKEPDPALSERDINIGNYYFKQKNYAAAIQRYLEAIEYQPNSIRAIDALARAYEKNGETARAIEAYKSFVEKNPEHSAEFQVKIARLEKKTN